jgi:hypothetical protein
VTGINVNTLTTVILGFGLVEKAVVGQHHQAQADGQGHHFLAHKNTRLIGKQSTSE